METIYLADGLITFTYSEDIIGHCEIIQLKLHEGVFLEAFEHVNLLDKERMLKHLATQLAKASLELLEDYI